MKTKAQAKTWLNSKIGTGTDWDGMYGFQCMDLAVAYMNYVTDGKVTMWGNAKDAIQNNFGDTATIYKNTTSFEPQYGDIAVWTTGNFSTYGHIAIVVDGNPNKDLQVFKSLDQNWYGGGLAKTELAQIITHNYDGVTHFIRPNFKSSNQTVTESKTVSKTSSNTSKKTTSDTKKSKTLKYNRDEVKGYKLPKRGYKPKFVVIHNDAGSLSAMQYHDSLVNAPLSRLENGIAHSYISGNTVWQALPESRTAWHTANQYGNTNGYGIEVCQSMSASDKDFLASEQSAFQEAARMLKKWGLPVDRNTVRLHNEFSPTQCPHRSMKLHAGYTSTQRAPQSVVNKTKDYFISQIKAYYNGKIPKGSTVSTSKKTSSNTSKNVSSGKWQKNQYGTWWMKESATFTCGGSPILARIGSPFLTAPEGYWFQPGGYVKYDEVCLQDGHIFIGYTWKGVRYYLPIRTAKGTPPNHSVGKLWGTIK